MHRRRIKHHLAHNITRKKSLLLFVGYQAVGTLGREIIEGKKEVRVLGVHRQVRARIRQIHGFSAHSDRGELLSWVKGIKKGPERIFVTHGEAKAAQSFGELLKSETDARVFVPAYGDGEEVFN